MAKIKPTMKLSYDLHIELSEEEAAALNALAGYNNQDFLKVFYEKLGKAYLQPHEKGLIALFDKVKATLPGQLYLVKEARKIILKSLSEELNGRP